MDVKLRPGTRIGSFELVSPVGSGAMGEVYRAKDLKLGRDVVVKVLPPELAKRSSRLWRFKQEARAASALNHPNIVTIYEIGEYEGLPYIVMEYVEGHTLRARLGEGTFPVEDLIRYAAQLAEGLAKAHQVGIVHRDLKPDNILISKDGYVKIVDFGLAKLLPEDASGSESDTVSRDGTIPGAMLGTVGYMSPEQVKGRRIDTRSDQFAFGAVVYEMITGRRAFRASSRAETIEAILGDEPRPIKEIRPDVPSNLRRIVRRCLKKKPADRFDSTSELSEALKALMDVRVAKASEASSRHIEPKRASRSTILAGGIVAAAAVAVALVVVGRPEGPGSAPVGEGGAGLADEPPHPLESRPSEPTRIAPTTVASTTTLPAPTTVRTTTTIVMATTTAAPPPPPLPARSTIAEAPPTPQPETTPVDHASEIREVLATLERAIETEDLDLYRQVKPNLTLAEAERLESSFRAVDAHDVELVIDSIDVRGDTATVRASRKDIIVVRGRTRRGDVRMQTFVLNRSQGRWVIEQMQ